MSQSTPPAGPVAQERRAQARELARQDRGARARHLLFLGLWLVIVAWGLSRGLGYYVLPNAERPFAPQYERLRPAGTDGLRFGVLGATAITVGVVTYSLRKRIRPLARAGKLKYWLEVHIFLCSIGPALVLFHSSFHVGGLIAIAFWSMIVVALSGVFGRYVYVRVPRTVHGQFASLAGVQQEREVLVERLRKDLGPQMEQVERLLNSAVRPPTTGFVRALFAAARFDLVRRATRRRLGALLRTLELPAATRAEVTRLLEQQLELEQSLSVMVPFQRLFRYWHLLHLPLAIVMFIVVGLHIGIAIAFGYAWPW
jgi:hypothetical protein